MRPLPRVIKATVTAVVLLNSWELKCGCYWFPLLFRFLKRVCISKKPRPWNAPGQQVQPLTLVGAVCVGLIAVVAAVVVPVAGPVIRDAAAAVTLKLSA